MSLREIFVRKLRKLRLLRTWRSMFSDIQQEPPEMFYKKSVFQNFAIFTGKHLCWSLFLIKLQVCFIKKTPAQVIFCEYCEILKKIYFEKNLWMAVSGHIPLAVVTFSSIFSRRLYCYLLITIHTESTIFTHIYYTVLAFLSIYNNNCTKNFKTFWRYVKPFSHSQ